ncbi:MAG: queG [Bacillales bacterium]|nr:queG [Bacillales bacterium]
MFCLKLVNGALRFFIFSKRVKNLNPSTLKEQIITYSKSNGIDLIGFTDAEPFYEEREFLKTQQEKNFHSGMEESDIEKRTNPKLHLVDAKSIISFAVAYPSRMRDEQLDDIARGVFSRSSWGIDYHKYLKDRLIKVEEFIKKIVPDSKTISMVDTGALIDRAVARRAGIGYIGKNCSLITKEYGSYVYLAEMITNIEFEKDIPVDNECGDCEICLKACPPSALIENGQINAKNCLSYVSQKKTVLTHKEAILLKDRIYGCDTCQVVCPKNKGITNHYHEELEPKLDEAYPSLLDMLNLSNREFKAQFGHIAGSWRGKNPIQRNAIINLANMKNIESIDKLIMILQKDDRPMLRTTAAWALGQLKEYDEKVKSTLLEASATEKDEVVLNQIKNSLS